MVLASKADRRRKRRLSENEPQYEKVARISTSYVKEDSSKKIKHLLPIKDISGAVIKQYEEYYVDDVVENGVIEGDHQDDEVMDKPEEKPKLNVQQIKMQIAKMCSNIVNEPQIHFSILKKLQNMMWTEKPMETCFIIRKLAMASMACVFTDIIPGYRIRERTEDEKSVKLSKEVRTLVDFEEGLLRHYRSFLESLEKVLKKEKNEKNPILSGEEKKELTFLAVKSLCELYEKTTHFNFHNNIVMVLVPLTNSSNKQISEMCCNSVRSIFRSDKSGEASLATIKVLCKLIKDESGSKRGIRPEVLDTLLSLHINHVDFEAMSRQPNKLSAKDKKKAAAEKKRLSRGQRKHLKRQEKLQNELKETEATERRETKIKYHTEIIQQVFLVYFRILKQKKGQRPERLLNSVLEGLAQFAHLINIDFFSDLIQVLQNLISSGDLNYRQNLCCISTAFKVLSGQGEALNIDPTEFYKHLYEALFQLIYSTTGYKRNVKRGRDENRLSDLNLTMNCLNIMLNKRRRQVTLGRLQAFIKRLAALSLNLHPASSAKAVLVITSKLIQSNTKTNALFDIESQAKGVYLAELEDPEHCGATSACLWELHALRRHYCPDLRKQSSKILRDSAKEQQHRHR
uniref:nucleolar complex protein 3 homolog n=1 Tax=Styela clava TaxID=7725 RepID=UPI001939C2BF|nr:nucleolar complex protein 3 homolog [Styela clava]